MQVALLANDMIVSTGDHHHVYLEGVRLINEEKGVKKMILQCPANQ
jgi:hypothetical protein